MYRKTPTHTFFFNFASINTHIAHPKKNVSHFVQVIKNYYYTPFFIFIEDNYLSFISTFLLKSMPI